MFSAGSDGIVKHFSSTTGRVISKVLVPKFGNHDDAPSILHAIDPQHLLLGTDAGALHIFDLRQDGLAAKPARTSFPHTDYISSIVPLPPPNASQGSSPGSDPVFPKQWVTTGGTTLAVTDMRSGTLVRSDDQEDDLLCATYVAGIGPKKAANRGIVAVGGSTGVLTMWDRGSWDDQQERVIVDSGRGGGDSIDAVALIPEELGYGKKVVAAVGDGSLRLVDLVRREVDVTATLRHDDSEGAVAVGFDCFGRMITAGGAIVKIWEDLTELQGNGAEDDEEEGSDEEEDEDEEEDSDDDEEEDEAEDAGGKKRAREEDSDEEDSDSDSEEERDRERRERQRKRREAIAARLGPMGAHGVLRFEGLD